MDIKLLAPLYMGWALGSNDAANIFGTAVSSFMVKYRTAVVLTAVFVTIGAIMGGRPGMETLAGLTGQTESTAFIAGLAAAMAVTLMTFLKLPVSTSQAVIGAILGIGIVNRHLETQGLVKVIICWISTPVGAGIISILLYIALAKLIRAKALHFLAYDKLMRVLLIMAGVYGAYSLGANNVANVTGIFYEAGILDMNQALILGGLSIGLGAITYSRNVMFAVGKSIIPIDAVSAFVAVLSHSIILHVYAGVGVPVSSSQAVVGAVLGIGMLKGIRTVSRAAVMKIVSGWVFTPIAGMFFCLLLYFLFYGQ